MKRFIKSLSKKSFGNEPYLIIQYTPLRSFVVLNNLPTDIKSTDHAANRMTGNKVSFLTFCWVTTSLVLAKTFDLLLRYVITDGLFCVDIFQTLSAGQVVAKVNDFGSR